MAAPLLSKLTIALIVESTANDVISVNFHKLPSSKLTELRIFVNLSQLIPPTKKLNLTTSAISLRHLQPSNSFNEVSCSCQ